MKLNPPSEIRLAYSKHVLRAHRGNFRPMTLQRFVIFFAVHIFAL